MTPRTRFWENEKVYWQDMPLAPFIWMLGIIVVSACISLLLPVLAYALQLWASSWNWRDRWATLRSLATPGLVFVCCLLLLGLLDHAQFWIIPFLISSVQGFWQTHLPGNLSLSPLDFHALVARLILWLPLAPGLALLYEYLAPRTRTHPRRILLQGDLVTPPLAPPTATAPAPAQEVTPEPVAPPPSAAQPAPAPAQKSAPTAQKKKQPPLHRKQQQPGTQPADTVEQMTIESFLAPDTQAAAAAQKTTETKATSQPSRQATPKPPPEEPTDWDNVLE